MKVIKLETYKYKAEMNGKSIVFYFSREMFQGRIITYSSYVNEAGEEVRVYASFFKDMKVIIKDMLSK